MWNEREMKLLHHIITKNSLRKITRINIRDGLLGNSCKELLKTRSEHGIYFKIHKIAEWNHKIIKRKKKNDEETESHQSSDDEEELSENSVQVEPKRKLSSSSNIRNRTLTDQQTSLPRKQNQNRTPESIRNPTSVPFASSGLVRKFY